MPIVTKRSPISATAELLLPLLLWKNTFNIKCLEIVDRYDDGVSGIEQETTHGLSIGTVTLDLG